jgi:hypothetical protein
MTTIERVDRGPLNASSMEQTATRARQHMSSAKPKGPTFGKSESQSRKHLASDAPPEPSGSFAITQRGKR